MAAATAETTINRRTRSPSDTGCHHPNRAAATAKRPVRTEERGQDPQRIEGEKHTIRSPCLGGRVRHIRRLVVQLCLHQGAGSAAVRTRRRPAKPGAMWGQLHRRAARTGFHGYGRQRHGDAWTLRVRLSALCREGLVEYSVSSRLLAVVAGCQEVQTDRIETEGNAP